MNPRVLLGTAGTFYEIVAGEPVAHKELKLNKARTCVAACGWHHARNTQTNDRSLHLETGRSGHKCSYELADSTYLACVGSWAYVKLRMSRYMR